VILTLIPLIGAVAIRLLSAAVKGHSQGLPPPETWDVSIDLALAAYGVIIVSVVKSFIRPDKPIPSDAGAVFAALVLVILILMVLTFVGPNMNWYKGIWLWIFAVVVPNVIGLFVFGSAIHAIGSNLGD
jgi:hypothetical protein